MRTRVLSLTIIWLCLVLALIPLVFRWPAQHFTRSPISWQITTAFCYGTAAAICFIIYRVELKNLSRPCSFSLVFLIFLITSIFNNLHSFNVDHASNYFASNGAWQANLQEIVLQLSPAAIPHSYRFLPNSIVRWIQLGGVSYGDARDIYRLLCGLLLFYAIYKFARLYTTYFGAIVSVLLVSSVYPVSFELYAGQLTDPLSHLSFVLAFIFLELEDFPLFLTTILIGSLAKETVLAMAGFYILFARRQKHYGMRVAILCVASLAAYFGVRLFVLHGHMHYKNVSGVAPGFVASNWNDKDWPIRFLLTGLAYLPFLGLAWRQTPLSLKRLTFFLMPVLFISGLLFSWLHESRNFMPLVFVLAVVAARYLAGALRQSSEEVQTLEPS